MEPSQLSFLLAQTSSYVTAPDQSKVVLQIRDMCRASSSILQQNIILSASYRVKLDWYF